MLDFKLEFNLSSFDRSVSFDQAVDNTLNDMSDYSNHSDLYLAFSGGMDSEFVLRAFHKRNIPITPIIVCCGNQEENKRAFQVTEELGIEPVFIEVKEKDYFKRFLSVSILLNGCNHNSIQPMVAAEYVREQGGILITGENFIVGDQSRLINEGEFLNALEGPFYNDVINKDVSIIHFFLYSPETAFSMIRDATGSIDWMTHKSKIYNIPVRQKIRAKYSDFLTKKIFDLNGSKREWPKHKFHLTKEEFDNIIKV